MPRETNIQIRRGSSAEWTSANPTLNNGEPGWDSTNKKLKIGDGTTPWSSLSAINEGGISEYSALIGNGSSTSFTVNHALSADIDVFVTVREVSSGEYVHPDIKYQDSNNVVIEFASAPTNNQYKVTVLGVSS